MREAMNFIDINKIGCYKENVSFKTLTTYRVGGFARLVVYPYNVDSLIKILKFLKEKSISFKILGNGSNILPSDNNYEGVIIRLSNLKKYEIKDNILTVEAGTNLLTLANSLSKSGYSGLEFACGIPGTIGGSIYSNAGAYLSSMSDIIISADVLDEDFNLITLNNKEIEFSYRKSIFSKKKYICIRAKIQLEKKDKAEIIELIEDRKIRRIETQPLEYPSAGSVFRNPENGYAGQLIEECHLKGKSIGGAMISIKHANFIINKNKATALDIKNLMDLARKEVKNKFNIELINEQELFNWE